MIRAFFVSAIQQLHGVYMNARELLGKDFDRLLALYTLLPKKRLKGSIDGVMFNFLLIEADDFIKKCASAICQAYGMELNHCRINEYGYSDFCTEHTDTAFPEASTLSVCLLHSTDSLYVDGKIVPEYEGSVTFIGNGVKHFVKSGSVRVSLVIWAKSVNT